MATIPSTEFKTHFGKYMNRSITEPVFIKRRDDEAVLISKEEYDRLIALEDAFWLNKALEAEKNGYLDVDESMDKLKNALNQAK